VLKTMGKFVTRGCILHTARFRTNGGEKSLATRTVERLFIVKMCACPWHADVLKLVCVGDVSG